MSGVDKPNAQTAQLRQDTEKYISNIKKGKETTTDLATIRSTYATIFLQNHNDAGNYRSWLEEKGKEQVEYLVLANILLSRGYGRADQYHRQVAAPKASQQLF